MDEPTDGLDPNQKFVVREMIKGMAKEKAIIISTHILEEVDAVCTRAIVIAHGEIKADGTPDKLRAMDPSGKLDVVFRNLTMEEKKTETKPEPKAEPPEVKSEIPPAEAETKEEEI